MDDNFYVTAATVIPVILLALAGERGYFNRRPTERPAESLYLLALLTGLAGGEMISIIGTLGAKHQTYVGKGVVLVAVTLGGLALVYPFFRGRLDALARTLPPRVVWVASRVCPLLPFVLVALLYVFNGDLVAAYVVFASVILMLTCAQVLHWREEARPQDKQAVHASSRPAEQDDQREERDPGAEHSA